MLVNADLHIHSRYSIAVSHTLTLEALESCCLKKGISVLGSGDALHPQWRRECLEFVEEGSEVLLVPTAEVEGADRVHHLIVMESFESFDALADALSKAGMNIARAGRPHVAMCGEELAHRVHELGGLIGPAHAFTPWTSLYAIHDSLSSCYGTSQADFLELGLSADSSYGARIAELQRIPFLSNSDAHSACPHALGREWNVLEITTFDAEGVIVAIKNGRIRENAGLYPELGKYNRTACSRCYRQFEIEEAAGLHWRCPDDGGRIKRGVADRVKALETHISGTRPPYRHVIPLIDAVSISLGCTSRNGARAKRLYWRLLETLGTEIEILTQVSVPEIAEVHDGVGEAIAALREGRIIIEPGGGGRFGRLYLEKSKDYTSNIRN